MLDETNRQVLERLGVSTDIDNVLEEYSDEVCWYCIDNITDKNLSPTNPSCDGRWCHQAAIEWLAEEAEVN